MGFLDDGAALQWQESLEFREYVRTHGVYQFVHLHENNRNRVETPKVPLDIYASFSDRNDTLDNAQLCQNCRSPHCHKGRAGHNRSDPLLLHSLSPPETTNQPSNYHTEESSTNGDRRLGDTNDQREYGERNGETIHQANGEKNGETIHQRNGERNFDGHNEGLHEDTKSSCRDETKKSREAEKTTEKKRQIVLQYPEQEELCKQPECIYPDDVITPTSRRETTSIDKIFPHEIAEAKKETNGQNEYCVYKEQAEFLCPDGIKKLIQTCQLKDCSVNCDYPGRCPRDFQCSLSDKQTPNSPPHKLDCSAGISTSPSSPAQVDDSLPICIQGEVTTLHCENGGNSSQNSLMENLSDSNNDHNNTIPKCIEISHPIANPAIQEKEAQTSPNPLKNAKNVDPPKLPQTSLWDDLPKDALPHQTCPCCCLFHRVPKLDSDYQPPDIANTLIGRPPPQELAPPHIVQNGLAKNLPNQILQNGHKEIHAQNHTNNQQVNPLSPNQTEPTNKLLKWGEEIEFTLLDLDDEGEVARVFLKAHDVIETLQKRELIYQRQYPDTYLSGWHPEYASFMVEGVTDPPFDLALDALLIVEPSLALRRFKVQEALEEMYGKEARRKVVLTMTGFPLLGVGDFATPKADPDPDTSFSSSRFLSDSITNIHPRFGTLTKNIRLRRGAKVCILIPIFVDTYTDQNPMWKDSVPLRSVSYKVCEDFGRKAGENVTMLGSSPPVKMENPPAKMENRPPKLQNPPLKMENLPPIESLGSSKFLTRPEEGEEISQSGCTSETLGSIVVDRAAVGALSEKTDNPVLRHIYMDAMGFGMGLSCVQSTYLCPTIRTARNLYDQLAILAPLWLAMTASTPFHRGLVADTDTRWEAIAASVDCRTFREQVRSIPKSRYSSISTYIGTHEDSTSRFNDTRVAGNEWCYDLLMRQGFSHSMGRHISSLFCRDPLVIYRHRITDLDDATCSDHFENVQSTNWNTVRFKPPPASSVPNTPSQIGWRVEFRPSEVQFTDFENAAFVALISILVKLLLASVTTKYNLYLPMSMNDMNMREASKRDAVLKGRFFFRTNLVGGEEIVKMSLHQIMFGYHASNPEESKSLFGKVGLVGLCKRYIWHEIEKGRCSSSTARLLFKYFEFIGWRTSGQVPTNARFIRDFIRKHPDYQHNSVIPPQAGYDLAVLAHSVGIGNSNIPLLYRDCLDVSNPQPLPTRISHILNRLQTP